MWMILGLFGALAAGAAADTMFSMRASSEQDDDTDAIDPADDTDGDLLSYATQQSLPDLPPDIPALFDNLDDRIHSSDSYAPAPPPEPVVATGGETASALNGGALDDSLTGGSAETYLAGHGGNDVLRATTGPTHQIGGEGDDVLIGGAGDDRLEGCDGDDVLIAGGGSNTLLGGAGNDLLVGAQFDDSFADISGPNFLNGGTGDDMLVAGQGDFLNGGSGADTFALGDWLRGGAAVSVMDYQSGEDQILLHYDPTRLPDPDVEIRFQDDAPETAQIWLNGQIIAQVMQAPDLTIADIGLVPLTGPGLGGLAA